jgi:hypothetical protein
MLCAMIPASLFATDLRGRVVRPDAGAVPAIGVHFVLQNQAGQNLMQTFSGGDGFYYLRNVAPGAYRLVYDYRSRRTGQAMSGALAVTVRGARSQDIVQIVVKD